MEHDLLLVELGERSYPITIGRGLSDVISGVVDDAKSKHRPVALLVDENVSIRQAGWLETAFGSIPRLVIPSGEGSKCFQQLERGCDFLAAERVDRSGLLFVVGGGVTGDLGGFLAASYLRGIEFYQVPTTLLSMVDSSVGGKTGINLTAGKNLVGAFHQPKGVFADLSLLKTLPPREFSAGMAEVIKHGMLADVSLFEQLEQLEHVLSPAHEALGAVVRRNCEIKAGVVKMDEKERATSGGRALLNLGHTFGHAIEAVAGYGVYLHGEAIGVGLVLAAHLSVQLGFLNEKAVERVRSLVARNGLPIQLKEPLSMDALISAMARDKKVNAGKLKFVAMKQLGAAITVNDVDLKQVRALWTEVGAH